MSAIIRNTATGKIQLLTKGADSVISQLLAPDQKQSLESTMHFVDEYAMNGLRTLLLAMKDLDEKTYTNWNQAQLLIEEGNAEDKEAQLAVNNLKIESNLQLIGSTAIEDKLQEGVPEAIKLLKRAKINIWVLTGDKIETAVNIGLSAGLLE